MQYLAKVQKKAFLGGAELQLLAEQTSDSTWTLLAAERMVETTRLLAFQEGNLVLVEIDSLNQITSVQDATAWVLGLVEHYLTYGVTPEALEQEIERAERWRQSLTLKSQEVDRRALETAARRDEIQELERSLKQEREELETRWEALQQIQADAPPPAEGSAALSRLRQGRRTIESQVGGAVAFLPDQIEARRRRWSPGLGAVFNGDLAPDGQQIQTHDPF